MPVILAAAVPVAPPVTPPVTTGTGQLYVVLAGTTPLVTFTGVDVKLPALQIVAVIAVIAGLGFTVTAVIPLAVPEQVLAVAVTV